MKIVRAEQDREIGQADRLTIGIAQISPIWLNRKASLNKVAACIADAAQQGCQLVVFGEALVPGYPFWVEKTNGALFNDPTQKALYAHYLDQGVDIDRGDLHEICALAKQRKIAIYLGIMERAADRGGHSLYCSLVYIDFNGTIQSVHRKLQPTYEERLVWAQGDGNGLVVHPLEGFRVGGLNCYENWMPMARTALYGQGEDLHISVWPGGAHNTIDVPVFIAKESRSYVVACCGLLPSAEIPADFIAREQIIANSGEYLANGGSTLIAPDGSCMVAPITNTEVLIVADLDHCQVREERQNFDPAGHYSRPDVLQLTVNQSRQSTVTFGSDSANTEA